VALQADGIHIGAIEQARIRPSVRGVAGSAAFGLHHVMLVDKWSGCLRMALGANCILLRGRLQPLPSEGSMGIVAIGTLDQPLFHLVVEGHGELRLDVRVALETEHWLGYLEQTLRILTGMNAVTAKATDIGFAVARTLKVGVLRHRASTSFAVPLAGLKILSTSPPPST
jgi:hypothetical protein